MSTPYFLQRLGLDPKAGERDIRRAYARELKQIDQEQDAAGFQHLRLCYEQAQNWVRYHDESEANDEADDDVFVLQDEHGAAPPSAPVVDSHANPEAAPLSTDEVNARGDDRGERIADPEVEQESKSSPGLTPSVVRFAEPQISDAQTVLTEFLPWLYAAAQGSSKPTLETVREALTRCLADPRMVGLDAGDEFERAIAHLLVQGWKPGHETLFVAALLQFDWEQDIRRLQRLGYAGNILAHAIAERQHFFQQEYYSTEAQRRVIEMLRQSVRPSDSDLIKYQPLVQGLAERYPHVLDIIAGQQRAEQWLQWAAEVPERVRITTMQIKMQEPPKGKSKSSRIPWGIAIFIGLRVLLHFFSIH